MFRDGLNAPEVQVITLREAHLGVRLVPKQLQKINALEKKVNRLLSNLTINIPNHNTTEERFERQECFCNMIESNDDKNHCGKDTSRFS